ncbi:ferredoxin [Vogesella fluminis]|uniref:(2Fe-2S) ferredoxin domain-containing protein n=1 Tax=Vogesella fluminis TaxID=1069161 RepID=UPI003635BCB9
MSFFDKHVFVCCNQRAEGETCCNNYGSSALLDYMKDQIKARGLNGSGQIRQQGRLSRPLRRGPVLVVYPQETWYTFIDKDDIDEIVEEHMVNGRVVERLKI